MDKKGVIIHLDNDLKGILQPSKDLFDQIGVEIDYIICSTKEEFENSILEHKDFVKALIFDLLSEEPTDGELNQKMPNFLKMLGQDLQPLIFQFLYIVDTLKLYQISSIIVGLFLK